LVIADIAGKGIGGALLMANLQANLRSQCANTPDEPISRLASVNQLFYDNTGDHAYATLLFAEYCARSQSLRFANCGHLPALLLRRDGAMEQLNSTCTVLGLFQNWKCVSEETPFRPGDLLVLYTDGLSEATNETGEEFGEYRLVAAIKRHQALRAGALVDALLDEVRLFAPSEQQDDITLIVAKVESQP
jgi:serine phosphatase RsbU (regulator of sigma subunit)